MMYQKCRPEERSAQEQRYLSICPAEIFSAGFLISPAPAAAGPAVNGQMMRTTETDRQFMRRAIELAAKGAGHTNPNPMVGAVIVRDGRIIGEGYHEQYGSLHAERSAFLHCTEPAEGADLYVTLEPCCHYGKQPPCTDAVIEHGIRRVFVGSSDPNPKVAGKGVRQLRDAGIEVTEGFLKEECDALNPVFFHFISTGEPYIALKYAMTADGKIATDTGKSQWITGEGARGHVQELRNYYTGILAGIGTVLADDPLLTCRLEGGRNPVRIILDTQLRIPETSRLVKTAKEVPLLILCGEGADAEKAERLAHAGAEVIPSALNEAGSISIEQALPVLGKRGIDGILVEGGGKVNAAFVKAGKVNRVYSFLGAEIFGGSGRYTPVSGAGIDEVADALQLSDPMVRIFGNDVLIRYEAKHRIAGIRA